MGTVRFLAPDTDAFVASVQRHRGEFEDRTGHRLEIRILGSDEYFSNRIGHRLSGDDAADVFMSGPVLLWEHAGAGLVEPLDEPRGATSRRSRAPCSTTTRPSWSRRPRATARSRCAGPRRSARPTRAAALRAAAADAERSFAASGRSGG